MVIDVINLCTRSRHTINQYLKLNYSMLWFLLTMAAHFSNPLLMLKHYIIMQKSPG